MLGYLSNRGDYTSLETLEAYSSPRELRGAVSFEEQMMSEGKYPSELLLAPYDDKLHCEWLDVITLELVH